MLGLVCAHTFCVLACPGCVCGPPRQVLFPGGKILKCRVCAHSHSWFVCVCVCVCVCACVCWSTYTSQLHSWTCTAGHSARLWAKTDIYIFIYTSICRNSNICMFVPNNHKTPTDNTCIFMNNVILKQHRCRHVAENTRIERVSVTVLHRSMNDIYIFVKDSCKNISYTETWCIHINRKGVNRFRTAYMQDGSRDNVCVCVCVCACVCLHACKHNISSSWCMCKTAS
jgi:hypothetical protein